MKKLSNTEGKFKQKALLMKKRAYLYKPQLLISFRPFFQELGAL